MSKIFKKNGVLLVILTAVLLLAACGGGSNNNEGASSNPTEPEETNETTSSFPERAINGTIMWGEGGATDNVARGLAPLVERHLGGSIVLTNRTGATGAIATQYVYDQPADGYNILMGAENPNLYGVLDISNLSFDDFYPVNILGRGVAVIVVPADSEFDTLEDVIEYAQANPNKLNVGSTGPGGIVHVVSSMLSAELDTQFNMIPYDGEGPALTALLGGHVDMTISGIVAAADYQEAGAVKVLAVVNDEPISQMPDVPPLSDIYPQFDKYLPWGPFYGVWVKKDTPDDIKEILVDAFAKGQQESEFQLLLERVGAVSMNIHGDEAVEFYKQWQSVTTWILHDSGETVVSPEDLGIPRID